MRRSISIAVVTAIAGIALCVAGCGGVAIDPNQDAPPSIADGALNVRDVASGISFDINQRRHLTVSLRVDEPTAKTIRWSGHRYGVSCTADGRVRTLMLDWPKGQNIARADFSSVLARPVTECRLTDSAGATRVKVAFPQSSPPPSAAAPATR